ncbi:hypothetical protein M434DRAFT_360419 [Hypoxylon sp. CO27-5]|nr:hypothetical protein M434DRAFT_360419 [Hypoxylon sp. CO27-5]
MHAILFPLTYLTTTIHGFGNRKHFDLQHQPNGSHGERIDDMIPYLTLSYQYPPYFFSLPSNTPLFFRFCMTLYTSSIPGKIHLYPLLPPHAQACWTL